MPHAPILIAASVAPPFLAQAVAILIAAALIAYVSFRAGLVPIVGFLLAGVAIGPHALGLVADPALVNAAAEVGVILLMFTIGIEFSLEKLARVKTLIFAGGGLQVALSSAATMGLLALFGVGWRAGLFTGFLLSLSSTAIVLKLIAERGDTATGYGQVSMGLLIFQDLAIIVMVLLVPMLGGAGGSGADVAWAIGKALAIILAVLLLARRLMPPLLERVARTCSPELFLLAVVAICFGTAWLTSTVGVSVSLGAFLAGLIVSESRFSHHAFSEIMPLQILFSAIFFVSVGMLLDVGFLATHLPLVGAAVALVLVVKVLTTTGSVVALGYPPAVAVAVGLTLAQVGEFSFVLDRAGAAVGLSPAGMGGAGSQALIAATVLLMVATPKLTAIGASSAERLKHRNTVRALEATHGPEPPHEDFARFEHHVIVAGYGDAARQLVRVLHGSRVPFLITTLSPGGANEAEREGLPVLRGDASRQATLLRAGIDRAKMVVVADDDPATSMRIVAVARTLAPTARILVRTRYQADAAALQREGADQVIADELESIVQIFAEVLRSYQIPPEQIEAHEQVIRTGGYAALRSPSDEPVVVCDVDGECLDTRRVVVRSEAPVAGQRLDALNLESSAGLTLRGIERDGRPALQDALVLGPGDVLTLSGGAAAFAAAAELFRPGGRYEEARQAARVADHIDLDATIAFAPQPGHACPHVNQIKPVRPGTRGCAECLEAGSRWVHLRICLTCGHIGCCDSSPHKHATAHHRATGHPIMRSMEPGETWGWCFLDQVML